MTEETIKRIRKFVEDRDWAQYHSPANLAKSISIEANELLECFQWSDTDYDLQHVKEELADVLVWYRGVSKYPLLYSAAMVSKKKSSVFTLQCHFGKIL